MQEKEVILVRKQNTPFTVNFPIDGRIKKYVWNGTNGKLIDKKPVPFEVYNWIAQYTTTFSEGMLIIAETEDEEINEIKETIENVNDVEKAILTKEEIVNILTTGNQNALKKELNNLTENLSEDAKNNIKRQIVTIASEVGVDSSTKRKVIAEWAGLNYENSDLLFDKELQEMYEKESDK